MTATHTRRMVLARIAGAAFVVPALVVPPAVAEVPEAPRLAPEERALLEVYWRLTETQRMALKDFAELGVELRKEHDAKRVGGTS